MRLITDAALARLGVDLHDEFEVVVFCRPLAKFQHLGKLISGIDMQNRKRHAPEKRFARQPNQNVRVFSHRPWHGDVLEGMMRLAKNENALVLELVEMSTCNGSHDLSGRGGSPEPPAREP